MSKAAWFLIGAALCADVVVGQEAPRRPAAATARAGDQSSPTRPSASVYGPRSAPPQRQAAAPRVNRGMKINQFAPRPRQPQATWGQLTPQDNAALELVLQAWEKRSSQVKTLECTFHCWKYDNVFGDGDRPSRLCQGVIRYAAPDKGQYRITHEATDPAKDPPEFVEKEGEYWVCDGNAVYEFKHEEKQLIERRLPDELKGKAISNSPLPFVFGTTAAKMRERYWMRLTTPQAAMGTEIWLQVEPIFAEDRANYKRATVILEEKRMLPKAVSLEVPNGSPTNYVFDPPSINNPWKKFMGTFNVPRTPAGWKRIVEEPPSPGNRPAAPDDAQTLRVPQRVKLK